MRVMAMIKATADSEAGTMPSQALLTAMGKFNEDLANAGVLLVGEGLKPSAHGARIGFSGAGRNVAEGPFGPAGELVAGFWLWQVRSMDEAIEWARRCPNPMPGNAVIEIRPLYEAADFGDASSDQMQASEASLRARVADASAG